MGGITNFEDLIAWQKARVLAVEVYRVTRSEKFSRDFGLSRQVQRAAVSVMANIAEGFERSGKGEFPYFLSTARASCAEVRSHLYIALDIGYIAKDDFSALMALAEEVGRVVSGLRISVEKRLKKIEPVAG